jgi:hypothetical protein
VGGETVFPKAENKVTGPEWSDCAKEVCPCRSICVVHRVVEEVGAHSPLNRPVCSPSTRLRLSISIRDLEAATSKVLRDDMLPLNSPQHSCPCGSAHILLQGLAVKAVQGDALLFYSLKPNGEEDPTSMHGSCPTLKVGCLTVMHSPMCLSVRCAGVDPPAAAYPGAPHQYLCDRPTDAPVSSPCAGREVVSCSCARAESAVKAQSRSAVWHFRCMPLADKCGCNSQ